MYSRKLNVGRGLRWGDGSRGKTLEVDVPPARSLGGSSWYESALCRITSVSTTQPQKYGVELVEFAPSLSPLTAIPRATPLPVQLNLTPVGEIPVQTWGYNITQMKTAGTAAGIHTGEWKAGPTFSVGDLAHLYYLPAAFLPGGDSRNVPNEFLLESLGTYIDDYYVAWVGIEQYGVNYHPWLHVWQGKLSDRTAGEEVTILNQTDGSRWEYGISAAADSAGRLHIVYSRDIGGQNWITYRVFDGNAWHDPESLLCARYLNYPVISLMEDGQPFVYVAGPDGEWSYSRASDGTWTETRHAAAGTVVGPLALGWTSAGDWYSLIVRDVTAVYISKNGGTHQRVIGDYEGSMTWATTCGDLVIGSDGTLHVVGFVNFVSAALHFYSSDEGATWTIEAISTPVAPRVTGNTTTVAEDADGILRCTYSHMWVGHEAGAYAWYQDNDGGWSGEQISITMRLPITAMALDQDGFPIIGAVQASTFDAYLYPEYPFGTPTLLGDCYMYTDLNRQMKVKTCGVRDVSQFVV